jgi:DNA-binding NtrC family response regulator
MPDRVLVTTGDLEHAVQVNAQLEAAGFDTAMITSFDDVREALRRRDPDCLVITGALHEPGTVRLLALAREREVSTLGLVEATEPDPKDLARELGLTAFLEKPADVGEVALVVRRLVDRRRLQQRTGIIGESPAIQEVLVKIEQMAPVRSTVLIEGESGSGKELVARGVHDLSPRRDQPFITVNCAALPETLLESELFGHERGAFTGALADHAGLFEHASGGTLFLDEITEMSPGLQAKLLRVLETRRFRRVGGRDEKLADFRVAAATNRDPESAVREGRLREDLYYRLNVFHIHVPPLRERREDIVPLAARFTASFAEQNARPLEGLSNEALSALEVYDWPGNVRELRNAIERAVVLARGTLIEVGDLPQRIQRPGVIIERGRVGVEPLHELERKAILGALENFSHNKTHAARALGISLKTLHNKLKRYASGDTA